MLGDNNKSSKLRLALKFNVVSNFFAYPRTLYRLCTSVEYCNLLLKKYQKSNAISIGKEEKFATAT